MTKDPDFVYGLVASEKLEELRENVRRRNVSLRTVEVKV